jgi:N6-adenosine-specific RNA methylase IME4
MDAAHETLDLAMDAPAAFHAASGYAFSCVVADPPWKVNRLESPGNVAFGTQGRVLKSVLLEYPTMSVEEIAALKVPAAKDAHLYIWTINSYIEDTYAIARAWGFEPSTMLYWLKQPMGLGLGGAFVPCVEPILFCRRGKLPWKSRCDRNWWGWPRGKHSQKPEEFQTVVESVSPGPYLEMFARRKRPGWVSWGNEVTPGVELETHNDRIVDSHEK